MIAEILEKIGSYNKDFDKSKILKAFDFAGDKYRDTEGCTTYSLNVLENLLPLKLDEDMIIAILLHDLYVLSSISDDSVKDNFGQGVLNLLLSLKKLYGLNYAENDKGAQVEVLRKMFLTLAKDLRVILIWISNRLCMLKNLDDLPEAGNKLKIAKETMNVYVPIASRLGIYRFKIQLEDLSFKYLNPQDYERLNLQVQQFTDSKKFQLGLIKQQLKNFLESRGIQAEVHGRIKNIHSIYIKLTRKGLNNVDELYDFFAMRVILPVQEEVDQLYSVLGLIHSEWKPISGRFKDYLAVPKPNGYRSLHTVVLGLGPKDMDKPVEIQIRDESMHNESEYGVASHWLYKTNRSATNLKDLNYHVDWVRGLKQIHEFFGAESDIMKEVEIDVFKDRIFVLTPRGEVKDLPLGSIPLDFAYAVHTDVGNRCVAAKVNGVMVSLDYQLKNGDVVEIVTKNDAFPRPKWLAMVKSGFARNKIKFWFSSVNRDKNIRAGRELVNAQLERLNKPLLDQNYSILKDYGSGNLTVMQRENLLEEVGKGGKFASDIIKKIYPYEKVLPTKMIVSKAEPDVSSDIAMEDIYSQIIVAGESNLPVKISACCKPKFGNKIFAYVTIDKRISIHRSDCPKLDGLNREKILFADWKGTKGVPGEKRFKVDIDLTVVSRVGLIHDITSIISGMGINILDIMIKRAGSGLYHDCFLLELDDLDKFDVLLDKLEGVTGVVKAVREDKFN